MGCIYNGVCSSLVALSLALSPSVCLSVCLSLFNSIQFKGLYWHGKHMLTLPKQVN